MYAVNVAPPSCERNQLATPGRGAAMYMSVLTAAVRGERRPCGFVIPETALLQAIEVLVTVPRRRPPARVHTYTRSEGIESLMPSSHTDVAVTPGSGIHAPTGARNTVSCVSSEIAPSAAVIVAVPVPTASARPREPAVFEIVATADPKMSTSPDR